MTIYVVYSISLSDYQSSFFPKYDAAINRRSFIGLKGRKMSMDKKMKGGIINIKGIQTVSNAKPPHNARKRDVSSKALSTGVEMLNDTLTSTLAKNVLGARGLTPRVVSALAAASDAVSKVREKVKSDERKRKHRSKPSPKK